MLHGRKDNCLPYNAKPHMSETGKELEVLWTPQQVAQYLSVSNVTVYRWLADGKVFDTTKVIRFARRVRIPRSEVERIAGSIKKDLEIK